MKGIWGCIVCALTLVVGSLYTVEAEAAFRGRSVSRTRTVQRGNVSNRSFNRSVNRGHHHSNFNSFNRGFDCYGGQEFFEERTVIRQSFR